MFTFFLNEFKVTDKIDFTNDIKAALDRTVCDIKEKHAWKINIGGDESRIAWLIGGIGSDSSKDGLNFFGVFDDETAEKMISKYRSGKHDPVREYKSGKYDAIRDEIPRARYLLDGVRITDEIRNTLDHLVYEIKSNEAKKINAGSPNAQVDWLAKYHGWQKIDVKTLLFDMVLQQKQALALLDEFHDVDAGHVEKKIAGMIRNTISGNLMRQVLSGAKTRFTDKNRKIADGNFISDYADSISTMINRRELKYRIVWLVGHGFSMDDIRTRILNTVSSLERARVFLDNIEITDQLQDRLLEMVENAVCAEYEAVDGFDIGFKRIMGHAAMNDLDKSGSEHQLAWLIENHHSEDELMACLSDPSMDDERLEI